MEKDNSDHHYRSGEAGIAMILIAVTVVGLGTLLIVLTIDVLRGKTAYSYAQSYADEICGPAAAALPFVAQVVAAVGAKVPDQLTGIGGYMNITKIRLISPMITINPGAAPPQTPYLPAGWSWPMTFSSFIPSHPCPASVCEFWGDIDADPTLRSYFPANLIEPEDYGQRAACVVEMEADTLLLGKRYVVAKSAVGLYVRDANPTNQKSVIIAVAPQMETIVPPTPSCPPPPGFVPTRFSPLQDTAPHNMNANNPLYQSCPVAPNTDPGGPNGSFNAASPIDPFVNSYNSFQYPASYFSVPTPSLGVITRLAPILPSHNPLASSDPIRSRREQQIASYNTVTAFRNRLLTHWVSRLSHMGSQRMGFQFLIINSMNSPAAIAAGQTYNPPTLVKGAGQDPRIDPLSRNSVIPTVNHKIDNTGRMYCAWTYDPACDQNQRAYINQLKKSYHVFHQPASPIDAGVRSLGDPSASNSLSGNLFEPVNYVAREQPAPHYDPSLPDPWEQRSSSDQLTLEELVRTLATEEGCPNNTDIPCQPDLFPLPGAKLPSGQLPPVYPRPDLEALVHYVAGTLGADAAYHPVGPMWAPAVGAFSEEFTPTISNPDPGGANGPNSSDLVIVTAKPIVDMAEANAIGTVVDTLDLNRKITVVFIVLSEAIRADIDTTSPYDDVLTRFNTAFRVGSRDSVVIQIAPDPSFTKIGYLFAGCGPGMGGNEDNCLYNFYNGLNVNYGGASPNPSWAHGETTFSEIADGIFNGRIAERRLAL